MEELWYRKKIDDPYPFAKNGPKLNTSMMYVANVFLTKNERRREMVRNFTIREDEDRNALFKCETSAQFFRLTREILAIESSRRQTRKKIWGAS